MKRIYVGLSLLLAVITVQAFASDSITVSEEIQQSFRKEFPGALLTEWTNPGDYYKATFMLAGHRTEAYFNQRGGLEGTVRTLFYDQLPLSVITAVDKRFTGATILDVLEVNNSDGTIYTLTLETNEKKIKVKWDSAGNFLESQKIKK
jgi:hypothetical protein